MPTDVSLARVLDAHLDDALALIDDERTTSYGELRQLCAATRAGLVAAGLVAGDRVGIVADNRQASVVSLLASVGAGMVAVPLNPSSPPAELRRELEAVDAKILLVGTEIDGGVHARPATPSGCAVSGVDPLPDGPDIDIVEAGADDLAVLLFTSGTAGAPKAAMLSHGNLVSNQLELIATAGAAIGPDSVNLVALPISHIFGLNAALLTTLRAGGRVVLTDRFDPVRCLELIAEHGVTGHAGAPPMWAAYLALPDAPPDAFASVTRLASGASALPREVFDGFRDRFGVELAEGYGLTETSPVVTTNLGHPVEPGSVGRVLPGVEVRIVDVDGTDAEPDDSGLVHVRGPNVFLGYWGDEEATKSVLDDEGWFATGDVGVLSAAGYLYLVDRQKDLIIVSGFNVYPAEVEDVLERHPAVDRVVVVGEIDADRGERVVAYVIAASGATPELGELVEFCREHLARYKCPSELHVVDELPIAASGKIVRRELG